MKICIIGAGVIGLSSGVRLKEVFGVDQPITIIADKFTTETTSDVAAGSFRPEHAPNVSGYFGPRSNVGRDILQLSYDRYEEILKSSEAELAGVHKLIGYDIQYPGLRDPGEVRTYQEILKNLCQELTASEIQAKFPKLPYGCTGSLMYTPLLSNRRYLPWLTKRFKEMGGTLEQRTVTDIKKLFEKYDIIVNCAGLGASLLVGDDTMVPCKGQILRLNLPHARKEFAYIWNGSENTPYFYWTPDYVVVGGCKYEGDGSLDYKKEDHDRIVSDCKNLFPWLDVSEENIVMKQVGLRPSRPAVRLELEPVSHKDSKRWIVHNYGHGGNGVSLSWGSACITGELLVPVLKQARL